MTVEGIGKRKKDKEASIHRQAQCTCKYCGEKHESTIAEPNQSFVGRSETIGVASDNAVGDALGHIQTMMGDAFTDYQGKYTSLRSGDSVSFSDVKGKPHTIQVKTLN